MGVHLCYGNPAGRHIIEPADTQVMVDLANAIFAAAKRKVDDFSLWFRPSVAASAAVVGQFRDAGFERMVVALPRNLATSAERTAWLEQEIGRAHV